MSSLRWKLKLSPPETTMDLLEIKQQLTYQRQELSNRLKTIQNDFDANDSLDDVLFSIAHKTKVELAKVKQTIALIESGDFGFCQQCGAPLNSQLLEQNPFQTMCERCEDTP
ncbi:MAG: hypothetical protein HWE10_04545 [Gammaproteobacteria bacterium]|nr:hypothetical protein [Gammaproteobacteria bacterium]